MKASKRVIDLLKKVEWSAWRTPPYSAPGVPNRKVFDACPICMALKPGSLGPGDITGHRKTCELDRVLTTLQLKKKKGE